MKTPGHRQAERTGNKVKGRVWDREWEVTRRDISGLPCLNFSLKAVGGGGLCVRYVSSAMMS